jgi:acetyl-CoA carboxylase biotin carboxyl carrier protein
MKFNLEDIKALMQALRDTGLTHLKLKRGEDELTLERRLEELVTGLASPVAGSIRSAEQSAAPHLSEAMAAPVVEKAGHFVTAPMVGTFYRSPSPEADSFVQVGSQVEEESVVGIIEAMKVMNEVKARCKGVVQEILVENGHPVEYGTRLFRVQ